ncbi:MAG: ubiquinol-cytochrome c chaperone [Hyphomicrobiales bacterium]|nr:ubiquinol-cytochrome c chaperone [Hyphomicrobiales bacterium]
MAASRRTALYERLQAPDRLDGRFELLTLHAGLVLRKLVALGGLGGDMAQDLVNSLFLHFDDTLREMAWSDIAVAKRLRIMKEAFYGRTSAYASAHDSRSRDELAAALARNVYGSRADSARNAAALADYVVSLDAALAAMPLEDFSTGRFRFPDGRIAAGDSSCPSP